MKKRPANQLFAILWVDSYPAANPPRFSAAMPLVPNSAYQPPRYLFNGHVQTIVPNLWRSVPEVAYERERIELDDGDFLDLDWS